jgi:putative transposase
MDDVHLIAAARYILLNPVRAGLVDRAVDWPYSSARAHLGRSTDTLVDLEGLGRRVGDWEALLAEEPTWSERTRFRKHERTGLPLGDEDFLADVEARIGRNLTREWGASLRPRRFQRG